MSLDHRFTFFTSHGNNVLHTTNAAQNTTLRLNGRQLLYLWLHRDSQRPIPCIRSCQTDPFFSDTHYSYRNISTRLIIIDIVSQKNISRRGKYHAKKQPEEQNKTHYSREDRHMTFNHRTATFQKPTCKPFHTPDRKITTFVCTRIATDVQ